MSFDFRQGHIPFMFLITHEKMCSCTFFSFLHFSTGYVRYNLIKWVETVDYRIVYFCQIQLAGLIEEHLPYHQSTDFKKHLPSQVLPKISTLLKVNLKGAAIKLR